MAATKFTETEREKLYAQLEAPFDPALIKWRVMRTFDYGRSGAILPFAIRAPIRTGSTISSRRRDGRASTQSRLCRRCAAWRGEGDRDQQDPGRHRRNDHAARQPHRHRRRVGRPGKRRHGGGRPSLQAACSCFGLGRYLYRFGETRVPLNSRGELVAIPTLPEWALPPA